MNYITSCPECKTQFLLTTEHLKAYRGKVQCGHCEHVFNAKNRLTEIPDDIHSAEEYYASLQNSEELAQVDVGNEPYIGNFQPSAQPASQPQKSANAESFKPTVIEDFAAETKFATKKTPFNIWLGLLSFLLLILAGLQSAYFMRTKIAAEYPQFKPLLVQTCNLLHCEIALPKELALLLIDDSDMQEDENYKGVINFSSSLINNANYAQTYPNIELTLTNIDDQPVLRRVIKPTEYTQAKTDFSAGIGAHEEMRIKLAIHASDLPVAGYRVLLVY